MDFIYEKDANVMLTRAKRIIMFVKIIKTAIFT